MIPTNPLRGLGLALLGLLTLGACKASQPEAPPAAAKPENARMWMTVGERRFSVTLADSDAARAFAARLPIALDMAELNGNEKHADVPQALPTEASRAGTIHSGDLMLYGSNTVVVFYKTFQSAYAYTRLGRVDDAVDLGRVLGRHGNRVVFSQR